MSERCTELRSDWGKIVALWIDELLQLKNTCALEVSVEFAPNMFIAITVQGTGPSVYMIAH